MTLRNVAIIQARMGSSRFPSKMLANLGGIPLIEWVFRRVMRSNAIAQVVLATTESSADDALANIASMLGIAVYRGSETDVLGRLQCAAIMSSADNVVRICADNPFIDPDEIDRLVSYFKDSNCDYSCNHQNRLGSGYADGFGAEILSAAVLEKITAITVDSLYREHATLYLWDHQNEYKISVVKAPIDLSYPELRFDVDTLGDLESLEELVNAGVGINSSAKDIIQIAKTKRQISSAYNSENVTDSLDKYLKRLFPLCRSITGNANRETLKLLQELIPLSIYEVPSGTKVYDWLIPDEWSIRDAWIADASGRRVIDFRVSNLHVVGYSEPVNTVIDWATLQPHLHRHSELREAIPYRTTYYKRDWGFCITHSQFDQLQKLGGPFTVVVDSEIKPGALTYGEYLIPGRSADEILISCYICHPSMANDSLSGILLTTFLARHITRLKERHWSYRIVFVPETIGAIAYCSRNEAAMKKINMGLVITTVGGPGKLGYKQSYDPSHPINAIIEEVLNENGNEFITYPFDIHGSDERQYSSQGFRVNVATISRDRYYEYPFYHSSLDDLSFVTAKQIEHTLEVYERLIEKLEARTIYRSLIPNCEVMLSRHDLYPATGGAQRPELNGRSELDLILWLMFLCDGKLDLDTIAARLEISTEELAIIANRLVAKGVLELL